jgi:hypothetical protein
MAPSITLYPVDNGDMTLIETANAKKILIDTHIRAAADDPDDDTPDVATWLRERLNRDADGRRYVDAFLLSHPDKDHCGGLDEHFHLGPLSTWDKKKDKIIIREIWSSPVVFRRACKEHPLCNDAKAFQKEAIRRVELYRKNRTSSDGDRILIMGEDENGKTDDLTAILIKVDETFSKINGAPDATIIMRLLGPLPAVDDEEEDTLTKNNSSVIMQYRLSSGTNTDACRFLSGGDADVAIWERQWARHKNSLGDLSYDLLQTPHHCSWHTLSYDSWSELGEKAKVSPDARNALSQARTGANIVASSKPITDNDSDPPCVRAKREYESITKSVNGTFRCTGEYPSSEKPGIMEFEITKDGPRLTAKRSNTIISVGSGAVGGQPLRHGQR